MIRGLYASAGGLLVQSARTDVISANLAGLSVPGYRRDVPIVEAFPYTLQHTARGRAGGPPGGAILLAPDTRLDLRPGPVHATGAPLDLALEGPGYFSVRTPTGEAYTRSGAFRRDPSGYLTTSAGHPVLGQAGPLQITGADFQVLENGDVIVDGARVDRLKLADFPPAVQLYKLGDGLLRPGAGAAPLPASRAPTAADLRVRQGYLEAANVNAVSELAAMISALRSFEANQRALQATDQTLDKAINDIGRL